MNVNYDRVCRLCLSSRGELLPIFPTTSSDDTEPFVLASKIKDCVSVQINENDELPTNVCRKCMDNVNNWHIFKTVCEKTQNKLHSLIKKDGSLLEEVKIKSEPLSDEAYDDGVVIDGSYPNLEVAGAANKLQPEGPPILASLGLTPRSDKKNVDPRMDWGRVHAILDMVQSNNVIDSLQTTEETDIVHKSDHDSDSEGELQSIPDTNKIGCDGYQCIDNSIMYKKPRTLPAYTTKGSKPTKRNISEKRCPRPKHAWQLLFTDDIFELIVSSTNANIALNYDDASTTSTEITSLIAILYLHGIMRPTHQKFSDLWDRNCGVPCVKAAMTYERFHLLLRNLRFDVSSIENNDTLIKYDSLKRIRRVFEMFAMNCRTAFNVETAAVVDEIIVPVYGPCPFRYDIDKKSLRRGIKLALLVDPTNFYVSNLDVIIDPFIPAEDIVKKITEHLSGSHTNIVMDSWYFSKSLMGDLKRSGLYTTAALHPNDELIPPIFQSKLRKDRSVLNGFLDDEISLTSLVNSQSKLINVISNVPKYYKRNYKMTIINAASAYKKNQSAVEVLDVLMHYYTTMQHSNDWTLSLFFTMLNIASINAQVIWLSQNRSMARRMFIRNLALDLLSQAVESSPHSPEKKLMKDPLSFLYQQQLQPRRRRCRICVKVDKRRNRKTKQYCVKCAEPICRQHTVTFCTGMESEKEEEEDYEEMNEPPVPVKVPHMPEVSITVMRPTGETLHSRQGIQEIASKDCLICGRSYRYSHNARRHELAAHNFDRYVNKVKKPHPFMQPKLRPNPFNPKARLMPNPISHKMQLIPKHMPSKMAPQKVIHPPKPIPIKPSKNSQKNTNLPYPLRIKALKDLQLKKKEPQILKTLLTSNPEVLVSEPEILNSGPESPETLVSEPEIASFQVEAILSEPGNEYDQNQEEDGEAEKDNQNQNYDTVDMESDHEIEIAQQQPLDGEDISHNEEENENHEEENEVDEVNKEVSDNEMDQDTGDIQPLMQIDENQVDGEAKEGEENEEIENEEQEANNEDNEEEGLPPAPLVEMNEETQQNSSSEMNEEEEEMDDTGDLNDTVDGDVKALDPDKRYVTKAQREFIGRYRNVIEQINTKRCLCCDKTYPRRKAVVQHLQKNGHKVPKHTCYNCVVTFTHIGALLSHMRSNSCTDLWKIIYDENGIPDDMVVKTEPKSKQGYYKDIFNARSYACRLCPAKFQLKQSIMKHVLDVHEDGQSVVTNTCVHCHANYKDKQLLKKHIRIGECTVYIHCDLCSEQFSNMQVFTEHALSVHSEHFEKSENQNKCIDGRVTDCSICGKKNSNYQNLVKHLKLIHNEDKPHYCHNCDAKFEQAAELNNHIYVEHSDQALGLLPLEPDMSLVKEEAEEYHYSCTECNAIFETVDAWTDHQVAEHNQVAHHCDQCDKKFLRPSELAEHKNTHLRVKFYPCSVCSNSYSTPQKLSEHMQHCHPGAGSSTAPDNEFFCDICVRSFKSRQAYSNHMRIHSKVPTTNRKPGEPKGFDPRIIGKPVKQFTMVQPVQSGIVNFKPNMNVPNAPYSCDICGKGFMHKKNIWKHKKVLHADIINDRNDSEENTMHGSTEDDEYNAEENGGLSTPQFNSFNFTNFSNNSMQQQPQQDPLPYSCELCYKRFPLRTSLWKHKRAKHGIVGSHLGSGEVQGTPGEGGRTSCTICKITFADKKSYYRHRKNVHKSATQMCKLCGKPLSSTQELYEHLKSTHARELLGYNANQNKSQDVAQDDADYENEPEAVDPNMDYQARYPCDTCGKQFVGLLALQNHQCINQVPSQPQTFDCEICHKSYTSIAALKSHRGWHLRSPDGKAAANNSGLWMPQHKVTSKVSKHEVLEPVPAPPRAQHSTPIAKRRLPPEVEVTVVNPNKKLRSDDSVEMDLQNSDAVEGRYCTICDKEFTKRAAYQRHMDEVHQPNSVFCPVCDRSFTRKSTLFVHMKKHYEGGEGSTSGTMQDDEGGHACDVCGAQFDNPKALRIHKERNHAEDSGESEDDMGAVAAPPGEFTCGQCGDGVASPRDLLAHRTMHATPTKYFCNICKVYFARALDLSTHTRARHSDNEKVFFPCAMCDRFYMNKKSLQRHIEMAH